MLHNVEEATTWRRMALPLEKWKEGWQLDQPVELIAKTDDGKLAHDVDDLSPLFDEFANGVHYTPLPCDDLEDVDASDDTSVAWIDSLDDDVVNVNDLSAAFDMLVGEETKTTETLENRKDENIEENDSDTDSSLDVKIILCAPCWATTAPLDPRSCIRTPIFQNLDSRIPRIQVPRMDLSFAVSCAFIKVADAPVVNRRAQLMSPTSEKAKVAKYHHSTETCWICKSSKTLERKRALHRYQEKRTRRNWKRGPRYSGRSNVATSRVRDGGRFMCTTRWI
ncbi:unnamed protein product [Peronospora belbahrii]|uniref:CCT domain-containing protein n=1 Tax=Peronospora belbahrii TaxID=622444 RepID=A0AAU9L9T4_9STRA|nr:unnamed protein product [Peronospora belbahrii]CAH0522661.1 unnamed protein product [Peronospora belbahrii]